VKGVDDIGLGPPQPLPLLATWQTVLCIIPHESISFVLFMHYAFSLSRFI
jgi:hypothetical protein